MLIINNVNYVNYNDFNYNDAVVTSSESSIVAQ